MKLTSRTRRVSRIDADMAKISIDSFLSDDPSWDEAWIGSRAGEDSTQRGVR
jgi:hypothetical protein